MTILDFVWSEAGVAAFNVLAYLQEEGGAAAAQTEDFTLWGMIQKMGPTALAVAIILFIMSMYSIAVMVERYLTYSAAKKQSREFAPKVAAALRDNRIEEAINISDRYKKSHLAMVVNAGLQDIQASGFGPHVIDSAKRALQRAMAIKTAEFKRGLSALATIGSTAPFVGLFGTVVGIINSFQGLAGDGGGGLSSVAGGISEALVATAAGLLVAIPAVMLYNAFNARVESYGIDMNDVASELIDFVLKEGRY